MSTGLVILGSFAFAALIVSGIADLIISRNKKRKPMATMNKRLPDDFELLTQQAEDRAAKSLAKIAADKPQSPAWSYKDTKKKSTTAMKAPIKRNKPKRKPQTKGKGK